jgi:serine/threonine protein kinase/roadblock/LC7 domain-containing protein
VSLSSGTKLGPYEIQSPLGAGGMGEVYRARDTRLDRSVAVKILPSHLSENSDAKQRFDREARTISSLNHPNICTLHDVGHQDGIDYLVMEYLEGETLADRLRKGPLPVDQVLRYGIEICEGLEKAHRGGVIHRDLKPGNIMLTKTGAKLMDFGLAKASVASAAPISALTATLTTPPGSHPLTAQGTVVGTFQYMSPEQVEGKEAEARSDIFALGAVLYEMATGKRAFEGKTAASAMAAVLEREPAPISSMQPAIPLSLERLVKTCLAKDPDERWQTVHDVKLQLKQIADGGSQVTQSAPILPPRKHTNALPWIVVAILGAVTVAALATAYLANQKELPVLRLAINPPEKAQFNIAGDDSGPPVISPNGRYVVFSANGNGGSQLYLRTLDAVSSQPLPGTEGATFPFWSPDSRSLGFFTPTKLKRIDINGGAPIAICDVTMARGGSWSQDGTIIAALTFTSGISRIPAAGGTPITLTKVDNKIYSSHRWPFFLPDGNHFLYNAVNHDSPNSPDTAVFFASIDGKENRLLFRTNSSAVYATGYLLSLRDNALVAQPFDPSAGKFTGEAQTLTENVNLDGGLWRANLSVSNNGVLLYASGTTANAQSLTWFDRSGKPIVTLEDERGGFYELELSPDQKKVAATDANTAAATIWVHDLVTKLKTRLSFTGGVQRGPVWSPDGRQIAYSSDQQSRVSAKEVGGSGPQQTLYSSPEATLQKVTAWSPDGRYILFEQGNGLNQKLFVLPLFGDRKPFPYGESSGGMFAGVFSPDGRWVAYHTNENGQMQVFVAPFPWTGAKWQVSPSNGSWPRWRGDGKEIFYDDFSSMAAVEVDGTGAAFRVGGNKQLFPIKMRGLSNEYDVSHDGQRFLMISDTVGSSQSLTVVQNWLAEVKKK